VAAHLTKDDAASLIDKYVRERPDREAEYQAWKQGKAIEGEFPQPKKPWWKLW
jgi:hypothetical protein